MLNVTFSGNSAGSGSGGAIAHFGAVSGNTLTLKNTIVADSPAGGNCFVPPGSLTDITSSGFNLSSDNSCSSFFNKPGDWNNTPAYLRPLTNNGGFTPTQMPVPPSKAIDGGSACPALDQRGVGRVGSACDIGAVEYVPGTLTPDLFLPLIMH